MTITVGMRVHSALEGQDGRVLELGTIGADRAALIQWLDSADRRDGEPTWACVANLSTAGSAPISTNRQGATGRGVATARSQSR